MVTCSPILIGRLAIDKTDPTVIDLHTDHFSNTVRKLSQEVVGLRSSSVHIGDPPLSALGYSSLILTDFSAICIFCFVLFVKSYRVEATAFCVLTSTILGVNDNP